MNLNLEMEGGVFERRVVPDPVRTFRHADSPDSGTDDYDPRDVHNLVSFVDLFYLWCVTQGVRETSMPRFELSATRLVAL